MPKIRRVKPALVFSPPKLPMGQNKKWDKMTDYEQEQVTTYILGPLVQHVVESLACLIWEFMEQGVYEGVNASKLEARQGPFHVLGSLFNYDDNIPEYYDHIPLCKPQIQTNTLGECDNLEFSTDGFQTAFQVEVSRRTVCAIPNREIRLSARTAYIDPYDAWKAYTRGMDPSPDYILDEVLMRTNSFIKLVVHKNRFYALFCHKLLIFENQKLLVCLRRNVMGYTTTIDFHDFLVLPNNDLIVVVRNAGEYEIKHLQF